MAKYLNPFTDCDAALRQHRDYNALLQIGRRMGVAKARGAGYAEGYAEGYAIGYLKERFTIANRMKNFGMDISAISQTTGLTIEEVGNL